MCAAGARPTQVEVGGTVYRLLKRRRRAPRQASQALRDLALGLYDATLTVHAISPNQARAAGGPSGAAARPLARQSSASIPSPLAAAAAAQTQSLHGVPLSVSGRCDERRQKAGAQHRVSIRLPRGSGRRWRTSRGRAHGAHCGTWPRARWASPPRTTTTSRGRAARAAATGREHAACHHACAS